jgi:hypothetical protein
MFPLHNQSIGYNGLNTTRGTEPEIRPCPDLLNTVQDQRPGGVKQHLILIRVRREHDHWIRTRSRRTANVPATTSTKSASDWMLRIAAFQSIHPLLASAMAAFRRGGETAPASCGHTRISGVHLHCAPSFISRGLKLHDEAEEGEDL